MYYNYLKLLMLQDILVKFYLLTTCFLQVCVLIKGEINLQIFGNVNGDIKSLESNLVERSLGSNYTLVCKTSFEDEDNDFSNAHLYWFKVPHKSKIPLKINNVSNNSVKLELNKLNIEDVGHYACVSLNYGVFKDIYLNVGKDLSKTDDRFESRNINLKRFKRDVYIVNRTYPYGDEYYGERNLPSFKDTLDESKRLLDLYYKEQEEQRRIDEERRNNEFNNNYHDIVNTKSHNSVLLCIIFVWVIIRCCGEKVHNSNTARTDYAVRTVHSTNAPYNPYPNTASRCGHLSCNRNHLLNPSGACTYVANPSAPTDPLFTPPEIDMPLFPMDNGNASRSAGLDLPPNYNTSVHSSRGSSRHSLHDTADGFSKRILDAADDKGPALPPSYAEAVASETTSSYNHQSTNNHHDSNNGGHHSSHNGHDSGAGGGDSGGGGESGGGGGDTGGGDSGGGGGSND